MTKRQLYEKAQKLPLLPGVYIMKDKGAKIIYIGKAKRLRLRVSQYFREGVPHEPKVEQMIEHAADFDFIVTGSEFEALVLECSQIKLHSPKYNILLRDDKGYSYIRIGRGPYPRITAELQKADDGAEWIGPYMSSYAVRQMVETAQDAFRLHRCTRQFPRDIGSGRPCLYYYIGKCSAPCSRRISEADYEECVRDAVHMIRHGRSELVGLLRSRMEEASEKLEFEKAAVLRDRIAAIEKTAGGQRVVQSTVKNADVFSFAAAHGAVCAAMLSLRDGRLTDKDEFIFRDTSDAAGVRDELLPRFYGGAREIPPRILIDRLPESAAELERMFSEQCGHPVTISVPKSGDGPRLVQMASVNAAESLTLRSGRVSREDRLLDALAQTLGLEKAPAVIESYDISNWGDGTSVAGMVVYEDGKKKKSGYRTFRIRSVAGTDDLASLAEALRRRAAEYEKGAAGQFGVRPDLILLDGGRGQLSAVSAALAGTAFREVPLFGMVKDDRHRTRAIVGAGGEISLSPNREVYSFVSGIQEEVHRFSIGYQRSRAKKKTLHSSLTGIPGVGEATARKLLRVFGTMQAIRSATEGELRQKAGIPQKTAAAVFSYFGGSVDKPAQSADNIHIDSAGGGGPEGDRP